ncbi:MAG: hypothetical protein ACJ8LG_25195 [Massilia sp.]
MWHIRLLTVALSGSLAACSTPYSPPVVVHDSSPFPGIASVIAQNSARAVDIVLVHGMCTHTPAWADGAIKTISSAVDANAGGQPAAPAAAAGARIEVIERTAPLAGGIARFHALIWSPLTAGLKHQLDYDNTGSPTDCTAAGECKPKRAYFNGKIKDQLLNDCLADAMIYEGVSHAALQQKMVDTLTRLLEDSEAKGGAAPLVVVAESLGSKILFDALAAMLQPEAPSHVRDLGQRASRRLALVFMAGNQLPMLDLAEQQAAAAQAARDGSQDALQRFLALRRQQAGPRAETFARLAVVAFTDPNDLLSYRLLPTRYQAPDVAIADVLVSNARTWLGLLEDPFAAHLDYLINPQVGSLIACGWPRSKVCR